MAPWGDGEVANHGGEPETLTQVLAGILKQVAQGWSSKEHNQRSQRQQFGLLWLGALVFTWPLFMLHFGRILRTQFSGSGDEELGLFSRGFRDECCTGHVTGLDCNERAKGGKRRCDCS